MNRTHNLVCRAALRSAFLLLLITAAAPATPAQGKAPLVPAVGARSSIAAGASAAGEHVGPLHAQMRLVGTVTPASAPVLPQSYFGLHVLHLPYGTAWPTMKFGSWRIWDAGVSWRQLETSSGVYNWTTLDTYVALAQQANVEIILELGQTPQWASARPTEASATGPGAAAEPTNPAEWTKYVTAVAKRYKGKIAYYEVWNEADSKPYWTGTPSALVQLTSLAYTAIKAADPAARVISPSLSSANPNQVAWLKSLFDVGLGKSIDVIGVHFYILGRTPEALSPAVQAVQALLHQYNLDGKPVFNTEFGWASPNTFNNVDDQSGYLMRSMLVGWGSGLQRFMWYAWDNSNWVTVTMTASDFKSPTMVAKAYATLESWTTNNEVSRCAVVTSALWACDITDPSGDHSRIYWNASGTTQLTPSLSWKPSRIVDMYGNASPYTGGILTVTGHPILVKE